MSIYNTFTSDELPSFRYVFADIDSLNYSRQDLVREWFHRSYREGIEIRVGISYLIALASVSLRRTII